MCHASTFGNTGVFDDPIGRLTQIGLQLTSGGRVRIIVRCRDLLFVEARRPRRRAHDSRLGRPGQPERRRARRAAPVRRRRSSRVRRALASPDSHLAGHCRTAAGGRRAGGGARSTARGAVAGRAAQKPAALLAAAAAALARGAERGLTPIVWSDAAYPPALTAIVDPPPVLWTRGSRAALERPAVAIVGSRAATPYALDVAERLAADLAARGLAIVSGLARGVDAAAHRGALSAGGSTVAVLGCGADIVYPKEHAALARAIEPDGLIISELVPGTRPLPQFFPQRNRIISGLSRAVVIVEAGERSGSLITARCALEQGRDVLAVPGQRAERTQPRRARAAAGWGKDCGGRGRYPGGADTAWSAAAPSARRMTAPCADPVLACLPPGEAMRSGRDFRAIRPQPRAVAAAVVRAGAAGADSPGRRRTVRPV